MEVNFFSAQIKLWSRIFDYKGTSNRKEYWFPFILHAALGLLAAVNVGLSFIPVPVVHYIFLILALFIIAYLILSVIPWIALTVRRLRDAGKSAWWALLLLIVGVGNIIILIICSGVSAFVPVINNTFDPMDNIIDGIYGPPGSFDPYDNSNGNIYGPPDMLDDYNNTDDDFDPEDNIEPVIYGPPVWDEDEQNYQLPEFNPGNNNEPDVYGPPDWYDN